MFSLSFPIKGDRKEKKYRKFSLSSSKTIKRVLGKEDTKD